MLERPELPNLADDFVRCQIFGHPIGILAHFLSIRLHPRRKAMPNAKIESKANALVSGGVLCLLEATDVSTNAP